MINAGSFKNGVTIEWEGDVWVIRFFQHVKPGKGSPFVKAKLQKVIGSGVIETTFKPEDKFNTAHIDKAEYQYLYKDDDFYYFMNNADYEQVQLPVADVEEDMKYVKENEMVKLSSYKGNVFAVEPPINVALEDTDTAPGFKGNTATNATKPAVVETGATIQVPLFIEVGEKIIIDTREGGEYKGRA